MSGILAVEAHPEGGYLLRSQSHDGAVASVLLLDGVAEITGGRLGDDEATARATAEFLLSHQDAADLPASIEIDEVLAAYPDAVEAIIARRGN